MIAERNRRVNDMPQGFQRSMTELEHTVDTCAERTGNRELPVGSETADGVDGEASGLRVIVLVNCAPMPSFRVTDGISPVKKPEHLHAA